MQQFVCEELKPEVENEIIRLGEILEGKDYPKERISSIIRNQLMSYLPTELIY